MSVLNVPMLCFSLKRGEMPEWAEDKIRNASSMKDVCDVAKKVDSDRKKALDEVQRLENELVEGDVRSVMKQIVDKVVVNLGELLFVFICVASHMTLCFSFIEGTVQQEEPVSMLASASTVSSVNSNSLSRALPGLRGTVIVTTILVSLCLTQGAPWTSPSRSHGALLPACSMCAPLPWTPLAWQQPCTQGTAV